MRWQVVVQIDGREVQRYSTAGMQRGVARLIAEVSAFMTLARGDLLMLGAGPAAPLARAGQTVRIDDRADRHAGTPSGGEGAA